MVSPFNGPEATDKWTEHPKDDDINGSDGDDIINGHQATTGHKEVKAMTLLLVLMMIIWTCCRGR